MNEDDGGDVANLKRKKNHLLGVKMLICLCAWDLTCIGAIPVNSS